MLMLKFALCVWLVFIISSALLLQAKNDRTFLSPILQKLFHYRSCDTQCPPWNCQDDSAVIHGFCCGCNRVRHGVQDNVPVPCYPDLRCPLKMQPLCADYDFMMDCCCTGP